MERRILLVNPLFIYHDPMERRLVEPYFPLGLLYVAAALRDAGWQVKVFDCALCPDDREFEEVLAQERPSYVGFSVLNTTRDPAMRLARKAHQAGATVIFGGADPTSRPADYLFPNDGNRAIDVVVCGEAEETAVELMDALYEAGPGELPLDRLADVKGIAFRRGDESQVTPERPFVADLDALPFPARDLIDIAGYQAVWREHHGYSSLSIITSRGCPFRCTWCAKAVFGRKYRQRSPQNVAAEMKLVKEAYHPDQVRMVDDILPLNRKWMAAWRDVVIERDAVIPFECLSRVDLVDEQVLQTMKETGCKRIWFGAESGSQKVLDAMKKGIKVEDTRDAAQAMRKVGLEMCFFIMLGYLTEDWEDIEMTIDLLKETRPDVYSVSVAYPLPGTEFYDVIRDRLMHDHDWHSTSQNTLLFKREKFSNDFYVWAQRLLHNEIKLAKLKSQPATPANLLARVKSLGKIKVCRAALGVLRHVPQEGLRPSFSLGGAPPARP